MGLTLAKLVANRASTQIDFGGGNVLAVEYYPAKITSKMLTDFASLGDLKAQPEARVLDLLGSASDILLTLLASWDLTEAGADGTETVLPIDRATIERLGVQIQWMIVAGLMNAQGEAPASGASVSAQASDAIS